jgi:DNA polymerase elongation subunit (family B)
MESLTYLTGTLPASINYPVEVAKRLNNRGLKPARGEMYTPTIVRNVVYGRSSDENIKIELIRLKAEQVDKENLVNSHLAAAQAILKAY